MADVVAELHQRAAFKEVSEPEETSRCSVCWTFSGQRKNEVRNSTNVLWVHVKETEQMWWLNLQFF